ncbi:MAG: nuclear transport factor 2 family protein [Novosphingobium sp.]|nr:nuclear transport factor 2 family protein [Novosphingobium sp.]
MDASLELRLRRIEANEAIRKLIATYAVGADRKNDPAILGPLFSEDAEWILDGVAHLVGREAIADGLSQIAETLVTWSLHYMVSPLIDLADDASSAKCRWYLWELATMKQDDGTEADSWYGGWYDSLLSVRDGVWLFDSVRLEPRLDSPNATPWTGKVTHD